MLLLARQLSPRLWVQAMRNGSDVMEASRNTLELAILKWASHTRSANLGRGVVQASQAEIERLATVFILTEAFGNLMALRRRLGKGQAILVTATAPFEYEPERGEVDDLIAIYDRRTGEIENNLARYGAFQPVEESSFNPPAFLFARWVSPEDFELGGAHEGKEHTASGRLVRTDLRISRYGFMSDLAETRAKMPAWSAQLVAHRGCSLIEVHALLHGITMELLVRYQDDRPLPTPLEMHGLYQLEFSLDELIDEIPHCEPYVDMEPPEAPTRAGLAAAAEFLTSCPNEIDIAAPLERRVLIRCGSTWIYDANQVTTAGPMFTGRLSPTLLNEQTAQFEKQVHDLVAEVGDQPWPARRMLRSGGRHITDVDASVVVDGVLIAIDTFASPWTADLDKGSHAATRSRANNLVAKLAKWDDRWNWIVQNAPDLLPPGTQRVLPVVVTPDAEWIGSTDPQLWLDRRTPRICHPRELLAWLRRSETRRSPHLV